MQVHARGRVGHGDQLHGAVATHLCQGQPERGHGGRATGQVACTLYRQGRQHVSVAKEHPRHRRSATGRKFLTTPGRGLSIDPHPFHGQRAKGHPESP
jgi:hypothetical protein